MIVSNIIASYGSLARFRDVPRLLKLGKSLVGASGDISDFQSLTSSLTELVMDEKNENDGNALYPEHLHEYLNRVMYSRRSKHDPLWNSLVIAGFHNEPYLGLVDLQGTSYTSDSIATGFGGYLAQPLLRKALEKKPLSKEEAIKVIDDAMRVLYYRDARSLNKMQRAVVDESGVEISEPYVLETDWAFAEDIKGYGA